MHAQSIIEIAVSYCDLVCVHRQQTNRSLNVKSQGNKFINQKHQMKTKKHATKNQTSAGHNKTKYNDWICPVCSNYNYSFRVRCNRCHLQQRSKPSSLPQQLVPRFSPFPEWQEYETDCENMGFPHSVFLLVSKEVWQNEETCLQYHQAEKEQWDSPEMKWIDQIIN